MRGLMLSELAWSEPGETATSRGSRRRRRVYIIAAVLLPLCLLGVLALVAYCSAAGRTTTPAASRTTTPAASRTTTPAASRTTTPAASRTTTPAAGRIPPPSMTTISGWIETAGLEAWPPAPPGDLRPNGTTTVPAAGPFRYIINEDNKCPAGGEPPFLVLLITVEAHQVERRDAIRRTWGIERPLAPGAAPRVVRLFLLGVKEGGEQGGALEEESQRHGDILQQDFVDSYRNLTAKTLMGLNWVARHCPRAAYVMKTDSDVFVNTEYLVHELLGWPDVKPRRNVFTGSVSVGRPIRDKDNKCYVSEEEYPSQKYPVYCSGTGYVFSGDLATRIYSGSLGVPRFPFEDVHVGMVLDRLRVPITPPPSPSLFRLWGLRPFDSDSYSRLVTSHYVTAHEMLDFWRRLRPAAEARYRRSSVLSQTDLTTRRLT